MLIITGISNAKKKKINLIWNIMSKRHKNLPTRTNIFISRVMIIIIYWLFQTNRCHLEVFPKILFEKML